MNDWGGYFALADEAAVVRGCAGQVDEFLEEVGWFGA